MIADETLVASFQSGDTDAFTELYNRYIRRIYDFVYYKTHHQQTAEDITAQAFLQMMENIQTYNPRKGAFSAWLHRIARNLVVDHYRGLKPTQSIEDVWDLADDADVESDADTAIRLETVKKALSGLSTKQRDVLLLRLWHGYAFAEIAQILGLTEAACKMQYKRGMTTVRRDLVLVLFLLLFSL